MKRVLLIFILNTIFLSTAYAQEWMWVKGATGNGVSTSTDIHHQNSKNSDSCNTTYHTIYRNELPS